MKQIYSWASEMLTHDTPSKRNPFAIPQINEKFGFNDAKLFRSANYAGPKTDIAYQVTHKVQPVSDSDRLAELHDLRYYFANTKKDIRAADDEFIQKNLKSATQDLSISHPLQTLENISMHPIRTSAHILNGLSSAIGMKAKEVYEDLGGQVYGLSEEKHSADPKVNKTLEQKMIKLSSEK